MTTAEHAAVRAQLDDIEALPHDQFRNVVGFALPRLFKEVFGDHVDGDKDGLKVEVRQLKRTVGAIGGVSLLLMIIQTSISLAQALHLHVGP